MCLSVRYIKFMICLAACRKIQIQINGYLHLVKLVGSHNYLADIILDLVLPLCLDTELGACGSGNAVAFRTGIQGVSLRIHNYNAFFGLISDGNRNRLRNTCCRILCNFLLEFQNNPRRRILLLRNQGSIILRNIQFHYCRLYKRKGSQKILCQPCFHIKLVTLLLIGLCCTESAACHVIDGI